MKIDLMTLAVLAAAGLASSAIAAPNDMDQRFLIKDLQGARFELALAKLAEGKAAKPQVRSYAQRIASDHTKANAALLQLVKSEGIQPPAGMTSENQATLDRLKSLRGAKFDKAYVDEVTRINAEDQQDSSKEQSSTQEPAIKSYLKSFASMDEQHKKMGEALKSLVS